MSTENNDDTSDPQKKLTLSKETVRPLDPAPDQPQQITWDPAQKDATWDTNNCDCEQPGSRR